MCHKRGMTSHKFQIEDCRRSVAFMNRTRKMVNEKWNLKERTSGDLYIEHLDIDDDAAQSAYVYKGLPVMSRVTKKDGTLINNESFVVDNVDGEKISLVSTFR